MDEKLAGDLFCSLLIARHILPARKIRSIVEEEKLPSLTAFWQKHREDLCKEDFTADQKENWNKFIKSDVYLRFEQYVSYVSSKGIRSFNLMDPLYPKYMHSLPNMPLILYYIGDIALLSERKSRVCIVGTRRPSAYGRRVSREFSRKLAAHDVVIVSGMARGVDTCAHEECLFSGGKTIAVMPCGLDLVYPKENHELFHRIASEGLILSELVPGTEPIRSYFPARNRILSAISDAVLITEAGSMSGTLHTASFAAAQGREVFVIPSIIYSETAEGNLSLLKDGATCATEPEDILAFLAHVAFFREMEEIRDTCMKRVLDEKVRNSPEDLTSGEIRTILMDSFSCGQMKTDELIKESGLPYRMVISELGKMELEGLISKEGNKYVLTIRV